MTDLKIWCYGAGTVTAYILPLCALALAVVAAGYAARAVALTRGSVPNQVIAALEDLKKRVLAAEENLAAHDARALQWRTEIDGLIEAAEDVLDRVEKKRRRIAGAEARAKRDGGEQPAVPQTEAELWARARKMGWA